MDQQGSRIHDQLGTGSKGVSKRTVLLKRVLYLVQSTLAFKLGKEREINAPSDKQSHSHDATDTKSQCIPKIVILEVSARDSTTAS
jgi:hypothetical protein